VGVEEGSVAFRIIVDSREQEPWGFTCPAVTRKLDAGDYSVEGLEDQVAVERKSLADFVRTVIHERRRFARELEKLAGYRAACVVIEADLDKVLRRKHPEELRSVSAGAVLGAALWITLRYGVPVFWCGSRQAAKAFTEGYLRTFVRTNCKGKCHGDCASAGGHCRCLRRGKGDPPS